MTGVESRTAAVRARLAKATGKVSLVARRYHLSGEVAVEYDARVDERTSVSIRVQFPDEARAMLESVSWGSGQSVRGVLDEVAQQYLERLVDSGVLAASNDKAPSNRSLVPLAFLRSALNRRRSS